MPGYFGTGVSCSPVVVSVQTVEIAIGPGATSGSEPLAFNITSQNAIPFASLRHTSREADGATFAFTFDDDSVDWVRASSNGAGARLHVSIVEFDPAAVAVQTVQHDATGNVDLPSAVVQANSFFTFNGAVDYGDVHKDRWLLSAALTGVDTMDVGRQDSSAGSVVGRIWVAEALNAEFSVQHVTGSITNGNSSDTIAINAVDPNESFLVYSYETTHDTDNVQDAYVACTLAANEVTCARDDTDDDITNLRVQVVSMPGAAIQRATATLSGSTTVVTQAINSVDTNRAIVNPGQTGTLGACRSDGSSSNASGPTAHATLELSMPDEVTTQRASGANGVAECSWEVIEWP